MVVIELTRYGPKIDRFLNETSTNFNELVTVKRNNLIQINGSYDISRLRDLVIENGETASTESVDAEFRLSYETAGDEVGVLTAARGRYVPGHPAEAGVGVRVPELPQADIEAKWGYFDLTRDPVELLDGAYFGVDQEGVFIGINRAGEEVEKVYKDDWNVNRDFDLDLSKGYVYQITFVYYGYGAVWFEIVDPESERKITLHKYIAEGETTFRNSNLKVAALVTGNENEEFEMFVSGRQFSIVGEPIFRERRISHLKTGTSIPAGEWRTIVSARKKENRRPVTITLQSLEIDTNRDLEVELRINPELENESEEDWETPRRHKEDEVSIEVNEVANVVGQNSDGPTGVKISSFLVQGGAGPSPRTLAERGLPQELPDEYVISLLIRNRSEQSATVTANSTLVEER